MPHMKMQPTPASARVGSERLRLNAIRLLAKLRKVNCGCSKTPVLNLVCRATKMWKQPPLPSSKAAHALTAPRCDSGFRRMALAGFATILIPSNKITILPHLHLTVSEHSVLQIGHNNLPTPVLAVNLDRGFNEEVIGFLFLVAHRIPAINQILSCVIESGGCVQKLNSFQFFLKSESGSA
jgi:hypothetical protein